MKLGKEDDSARRFSVSIKLTTYNIGQIATTEMEGSVAMIRLGLSKAPSGIDVRGARISAAVLLVFLYASTALAQLAGTYSVGAGQDYPSLSAAVDSLKSQGMNGSVNFQIVPGVYNEQFAIDAAISGYAPADSIIFESSTGIPTDVEIHFSPNSTSSNYVAKISGDENIVFRNLRFTNPSVSYTRVAWLSGNVSNKTFSSCRFEGGVPSGNGTGENYGLVAGPPGSRWVNVAVRDCTFMGAGSGVYLSSISASHSQSVTVARCAFLNQKYRAVYLYNCDSPTLTGNRTQNTYSSAGGFQLASCNGGGLLANNFIHSNSTGVYVQSCTNLTVVFNSVHIPNGTSNAFLASSSNSGLVFKNNVLAVSGAGAVYNITIAPGVTGDHNLLFTQGSVLAEWQGQEFPDLSSLQLATGQESSSVSFSPGFQGETDLHTGLSFLAGMGTPIAGIMDDIDGELRDPIAPDIGADEFAAALSPLAGEYSVGAGGDYANIESAIQELATHGLNGATFFRILPGIYSEQMELVRGIPAISSADSVVFESSTGVPTDVEIRHAATASADAYVVRLRGSDKVTFRNLSVMNSSPSWPRIIWADQQTSRKRITDCRLVGGHKSSLGGSLHDALIAGYELLDVEVTHCTLTEGGYGVYIGGPSSRVIVSDCVFGWSRNEALRIVNASNVTVERNAFLDGYTYALYLTQISSGLIANNFLYRPSRVALLVNLEQVTIVYNSLHEGDGFHTVLDVRAPLVDVLIQNNVIAHSGTGKAYSFDTLGGYVARNNDLFSAGPILAQVAGEDYADLGSLQASTGQETGSVSVVPGFNSPTDLHSSSPFLDGAAIPIPEVTSDIDGDARDPVAPDIGADEFAVSQPPMAGTYTVGQGGDFALPGDAANALITRGISAPVTIELLPGNYVGQMDFSSAIPGASQSNRVTVRSQNDDATATSVQYSATSALDNFVVRLAGSDYLSIEGIGFLSTASNRSRSLVLEGQCDSLQIRRCIFGSVNTSNVEQLSGSALDGFVFADNEINGGSAGFVMGGAALHSVFVRNTVGGVSGTSLQLNDLYDVQISENEVQGRGRGIQVIDSQDIGIYNNWVRPEPGGSSTGIYLVNTDAARVFNNSVEIQSGPFPALHVDGTSSGARLLNNILVSRSGGYAVRVGPAATVDQSDYNDLFVADGPLAYWGVDRVDLQALQAATGMDTHSIPWEPGFVAAGNVHVNRAATNGRGLPLTEVSVDIDGQARDAQFPDIGADEFDPDRITVTFQLDARRLLRSGLLRVDLGMRPVVQSFGGAYAGAVLLGDADADSIWTGSLVQALPANVSYAFSLDFNGDGSNAGDWIYELGGVQGGRTLTTEDLGEMFAAPEQFDDLDANTVVGGAARSGVLTLRTSDIGVHEFESGSESLYASLVVGGQAAPLVLACRLYGGAPTGAPPSGIARMASGLYWTIDVAPANANCIATLVADYSAISGISVPADLRLLHRPSSSAPWQVISTSVNQATSSLSTPAISLAGDWTVGSTTTANDLLPALPPAPQQPSPIVGQVQVPIQPICSWTGGETGLLYDIYFWRQGDPIPTSPTASNLSVPVYVVSSSLSYNSTYLWRVDAKNLWGVTPGPEWSFDTEALPDLVVAEISVPSTVSPGGILDLSYRIMNVGQGPTNAPSWIERIYVHDQPLSLGVPLTSQPSLMQLGPGESYLAARQVTLPCDLNGSYYVTVYVDATYLVKESDDQNNKTTSIGTFLSPNVAADLAVTTVTAPPTAFSGSTVSVQWTVENVGQSATYYICGTASWQDAVRFSTNPSLLDPDAKTLTTEPRDIQLNPGEGYTLTRAVTLPHAIHGTFYMGVFTDSGHRLGEYGLEENNILSIPIEVILSPPPDLQVASIDVPDTLASGRSASLGWSIANLGAGAPFESSFIDKAFLSASAVLDPDSAVVIASSWRQAALFVPDANLSTTTQAVVPNGLEGIFYMHIMADANSNVFEYNDEDNNSSASPVYVRLSPASDLVCSDIAFQAGATAGDSISVTWTTTNGGSGTTYAARWHDKVYLAQSPDFDLGQAVYLGQQQHAHSLAPAESYSGVVRAKLPADHSGTFNVWVRSDSEDAEYENGIEDNNMAASASQLTIAPYPPVDLRAVLAAPDSVVTGAQFQVTLQVRNHGAGTTLQAQWRDRVYLSTDQIVDASDLVLSDTVHSGILRADEMYVGFHTVTVPDGTQGLHFLLGKTDVSDVVDESIEANNTAAQALFVEQRPYANLAIVQFIVPPAATTGDSVVVIWTVRNLGEESIGQWSERVYLSRDQVRSGDDIRLASTFGTGDLPPGGDWGESRTLGIPLYSAGDLYLILVIDEQNEIYEGAADNNNTAAELIGVVLPPPVDIAVNNIIAPDSVIAGQLASIEWSLANAGTNDIDSDVRTGIYLSADAVWDIDDVVVSIEDDHVVIPVGQSLQRRSELSWDKVFEAQFSEDPMPGIVPGDYRVVVKTDLLHRLREFEQANNELGAETTTTMSIPILASGTTEEFQLQQRHSAFYQIEVPAGENLFLELISDSGTAVNSLCAAAGRVPTVADYDFEGVNPFGANQTTLVPSASGGVYFVQVLARQAAGTQQMQLAATIAPFGAFRVEPAHVGQGRVTTAVYGAGFSDSTIVTLRADGQEYHPLGVKFLDPTHIDAKWDLSGVPVGSYSLVVEQDSMAAVAQLPVVVETALDVDPQFIVTSRELPGLGRVPPTVPSLNSGGTIKLEVSNIGNVDLDYAWVVVAVPDAAADVLAATGDEHCMTMRDLGADEPSVKITGTDFWELEGTGFLIRGLRPGQSARMAIKLGRLRLQTGQFSDVFPILEAAALPTPPQYSQFWAQGFASSREHILANPSIYPAEWASLASDPAQYFVAIGAELVSRNVLDPVDLAGFVETGLAGDGYSSSQQDWSDSQSSSSRNGTKMWVAGGFPPPDYCGLYSWDDEICNFTTGLLCAASTATACVVTGPADLWCTAYLYLQCWEYSKMVCRDYKRVYNVLCPTVVHGGDPNDMVGPAGYGAGKWVSGTENLEYTILFENDPVVANAPARQVTIRHPIDPHARASSFRLGAFGFAGHEYEVPAGRAFYSTRVDLTDSMGIFLDVTAGLDVSTNDAFWTLRSIDPSTGDLPVDPAMGFLAINDSTGVGEGFVSFAIRPANAIALGDSIASSAIIVFDDEPAIATPTVVNRVDPDPPTSGLTSSNFAPGDSVTVFSRYAASDQSPGAGLRGVQLYVSENGGPFLAYGELTTEPVITFAGDLANDYGFFTLAMDNVANQESLKTVPETIVRTDGTGVGGPNEFLLLLAQNFPNPFNPKTFIHYSIRQNEQVSLKIYDVRGRLVQTLVDGVELAGSHEAAWLGDDERGRRVASGIYLYVLHTSEGSMTRKMVLLR